MVRVIRPSSVAVGAVLVFLNVVEAAPPTFTSAVPLQAPAGQQTPADGWSWVMVGKHGAVSAGYGAAGQNGNTGINRAARWSVDGSATLLGDVPGQITSSSWAYCINAAGQAAGYANLSGVGDRAVRWSADGSATLLGDVPGNATSPTYAWGINAAGEAVGVVGGGLAVRWSADGSAMLLGEVPGQTTIASGAAAINAAGQIAGTANLKGASGGVLSRAALWSADGSITLLGDVPGRTVLGCGANCISPAGLTAGLAYTADLPHGRAVRWSADGSATLLDDVPGLLTQSTTAYGVTDAGLVVGDVFLDSGEGFRAMLWDAAGHGSLLQSLMGDGNSWTFEHAYAIDADATTLRVMAYGSKDDGETYNWYFVNAPLPEPTAAGLLALAAPALFTRRLRQR